MINWYGRSCHVLIAGDAEDEPFEVVWMLRDGQQRCMPDEGRLKVYMKEYNSRRSFVEIMEYNARMVWLLDVPPTALGCGD